MIPLIAALLMTQTLENKDTFVINQFVVEFNVPLTEKEAAEVLKPLVVKRIKAVVIRTYPPVKLFVIHIEGTEDKMKELLKNPKVKYVERKR